MTTSKRLKSATAGPVIDTHLELKMLCLFHFVIKSDKKALCWDCSGTVSCAFR